MIERRHRADALAKDFTQMSKAKSIRANIFMVDVEFRPDQLRALQKFAESIFLKEKSVPCALQARVLARLRAAAPTAFAARRHRRGNGFVARTRAHELITNPRATRHLPTRTPADLRDAVRGGPRHDG